MLRRVGDEDSADIIVLLDMRAWTEVELPLDRILAGGSGCQIVESVFAGCINLRTENVEKSLGPERAGRGEATNAALVTAREATGRRGSNALFTQKYSEVVSERGR